ncbi:bacteriohemerythrin [Motiliproteus sediminis]|uniref:bacteriohemerythrin n=1 Tax=Motiliproteus sediminis TaxID=1468178 RepID=UPI001FE353F5|nr:hemerythrin family protein [Motiliproteus sediminis]
MFELTEQDLTLAWSGEYSVGEPIIDQQHQQMFELYNELVALFIAGRPGTDFVQTATGLLSLSQQHFEDEERLMAAAGAGDLDSHRHKHAELITGLQTMTAELDMVSATPSVAMMVVFRDWILTHILSEDLQLRPLWAASEQG